MNKLLIVFFMFISNITFTYSKTLIISDSHGTGPFGDELVKLLEKNSKQNVSLYAFGGSKAIDWIHGPNLKWGYWEYHSGKTSLRGENRSVPKLEELIDRHKPTHIIINLGTNMVWKEPRYADDEAIINLIQQTFAISSKCTWIGQPDLRIPHPDNRRTNDLVKLQLQRLTHKYNCKLIESWTFTKYPDIVGDGIHYDQIPVDGEKLSRQWAKDVYQRIK